MLAQSNAGIVTRMTIWLMPRPKVIEGFAFQVDDSSAFSKVVDQISKLRQAGIIDSVVHLANDLRVVSSQPWMGEYSEHNGPFDSVIRDRFKKRAGVSNWNGLGGIYGSAAIVSAKKREIKNALKSICRVRFFSQRKVKALEVAAKRLPNVGAVERLKKPIDRGHRCFRSANGLAKPQPS